MHAAPTGMEGAGWAVLLGGTGLGMPGGSP